MMKALSGMVAIKGNNEDYLAVIGGWGPSSNNTPPQPAAQYSESGGYQRCNEVYMYRLKTGQYNNMILGYKSSLMIKVFLSRKKFLK